MSIPALNNTSDYDVYFKQYLKSLEIQNDLNKKNFDANYAFRKTGVQETERPDMRPIEERMSDVEKLKVQARMMLNKVTDANNTNQIMEYLLQNNNILFFFIQNFPALEEVVKRQFSGGILASQMISLIYKAYLKYTDEALIPDSDDYQLVISLVTQEDVAELMNSINVDIPRSRELFDLLRNTKDSYPTLGEIQNIIKNPERKVKEIHEYAKTNKNGLTKEEITPLIEAYNDRKVLGRGGKNEQTIFEKEYELYEKLKKGLPLEEESEKKVSNVPSKALILKQPKPISIKSIESKIKKNDDAIAKSIIKQNKNLEIYRTQKRETKKKKDAEEAVKREEEKQRLLLEDNARLRSQFLPDIQAVAQAKSAAAQAKADAAAQAQAQPTQTGTGLMDNREKHIHRFKVLKGEILAGNLSSSVIKELKSLVVKMINFNELEPPQVLMILKELHKIK